MLINIVLIVVGTLIAFVGLIVTIIAFSCQSSIDYILSVPLLIFGIVIVCICSNNIVEIKVNERLEQFEIVKGVEDK